MSYKPFVPIKLLQPHLRLAVREAGSHRQLAHVFAATQHVSLQTAERKLRACLGGEVDRVTFPVADRLVTHLLGGPTLWHTDPELNRIYQGAA